MFFLVTYVVFKEQKKLTKTVSYLLFAVNSFIDCGLAFVLLNAYS